MIRLHFTFNKENMAAWLNEMDRKGWALRRTVAGFCSFERTEPGTYDYQIDFAGGNSFDADYRALMEDLGIEIVCRWGPWVVLRRPAADGPFRLYTDSDSRLEQLRRVRRFFKIMACLELLCVIWLAALSALEPGYLWLLVFAGIGLAAAIGMIVQVRHVCAEMRDLGEPCGSFADDRTARILIGTGCLVLCVGFLSADAPWVGLPEILKGCGFGLVLLGVLRAMWRRSRT